MNSIPDSNSVPGDPSAERQPVEVSLDLARGSELWGQLYEELRCVADRMMRRQPPGHTLQTTALMNEAYLRFVRGAASHFESEPQFFALASQVMRSVLVDHARGKQRVKRQAPGERVSLDRIAAAYAEQDVDLVDLDDALRKLGERDPKLVELVELRYFGGRTIAEAAAMLGLSCRTVEREWAFARGWLRKALS